MAAIRHPHPSRPMPRIFVADERRVVIGPITDLSSRALARLRRLLQSVVDEDWNRGRARVVEVDLSDSLPERPGLMKVLADAREELEAIGGRLMVIARGSRPVPPG